MLTVLVVDDYEPFRRAVRLILQLRGELQVVGEASDGLEAVRKAKELSPDLILLDIDLPKLNGIQAARRLRDLVPSAKILFLTVESSSEVLEEALNSGGAGYVDKLSAHSDLIPAIETVLRGRQFVSSGLEYDSSKSKANQFASHNHEMLIYSEEAVLIENFTCFITAALGAGNPAIVIATKPQLDGLQQALSARGLDMPAATESGAFTPLEVSRKLSTFMINDAFDPVRFVNGATDLIRKTAKVATGVPARIAVCGISAPSLWAEGKTDAALRLEQLWDNLVKVHAVDSLCAYSSSSFHERAHEHAFRDICAQHSAVYSR